MKRTLSNEDIEVMVHSLLNRGNWHTTAYKLTRVSGIDAMLFGMAALKAGLKKEHFLKLAELVEKRAAEDEATETEFFFSGGPMQRANGLNEVHP